MFTHVIQNTSDWKKEKGAGVFHYWSTVTQYTENGVMHYPVAIVEDKDGNVFKVDPDGLRFTDRGPIKMGQN